MDGYSPTPFLFANLTNWLLHGVLTLQTYLYYIAFNEDRAWIKAVVYTVYIMETVQALCLAILLSLTFQDGVAALNPGTVLSDFVQALIGNPRSIARGSWKSFFTAVVIELSGGLVPLISQCVYAHRIHVITQMKVIPCVVVALALGQFIAVILAGVAWGGFLFMWICINVINDTLIAVILVRAIIRRKPLSHELSGKITRLVYLILGTGIMTVAVNLVALVLYWFPAVGLYTLYPLLMVLPKLYANSILVMLNNRIRLISSRRRPLNSESDHVITSFVVASAPGASTDSDT